MEPKQDPIEKLTQACARHEEHATRLVGQTRYRDDVILEAKNAGASWPQLMAITGLSRRGVHLALERARQA